jgi:hypothetical protein
MKQQPQLIKARHKIHHRRRHLILQITHHLIILQQQAHQTQILLTQPRMELKTKQVIQIVPFQIITPQLTLPQ